MIKVLVYTSDPYLWLIKPFSYLFNIYWSELQDVVVGGFTKPQFTLPKNFTFHQIDKKPYPKERWSDGLIRFLNDIQDDTFVLLLEDYFIYRTVDCGGIETINSYMHMGKNEDVVRFDLTADRLYGKGMRDVEPWGHYDIISCDKDAMYEMSLQAAIWNRRNFLNLLRPNMNPWEVEVQTDMTAQPYRVLGTRQWPIRYANIMLKGSIVDYELNYIQEPHQQEIRMMIEKESKYGTHIARAS